MAETTTNTSDTNRPPNWFVRTSKWLWKRQKFIWGTVILGLALNAIASLLFIPLPLNTNKSLDGTLFQWFIQHPLVFMVAGIFILLLVFIIYLGSRFEIHEVIQAQQPQEVIQAQQPSEHIKIDADQAIRNRYLNQIRINTELLTLKGIPAGLISEAVRLDEVFIPLQFRLNRPRTDYPLTERELATFREQRSLGKLSALQEHVLITAEKDWQYILKKSDRISIAELWQQFTEEQPTIVIQGARGMGKSTFLERLTLFMARRCLGKPDPEMPEQERISPPLIPILIRLGEYASALSDFSSLSLEDYLKQVLGKFTIEGLDTYIFEKGLKNGACLVMLDGLDEVSKPDIREQVQQAIRDFIQLHRNTPKESNRFIITSRIAGYDQHAFPDYTHITVAELTDEQIDYFLPRWCHANVRRSRGINANSPEEQEAIDRATEQQIADLKNALQGHQAVKELAENPLLLTLLAVMQQNSISLPRQRVELYSTVTKTLLENRNIIKNIDPIPEEEAIKRLGPLAFIMQAQDSFASEDEVITELRKVIAQAGGTSKEIANEADVFLQRIRERGGLFVQRTGDYFAFMHRTFQEYFAARYVLNLIEDNPTTWLPKFVDMSRQENALWREPFRLAVAYQSKANKKNASEILNTLLTSSLTSGQAQKEHDILLATECIIEAAPSFDKTLETHIAQQLLQTYQVAQQKQRFKICDSIESVMIRWLLSLPREAYRPPVLAVLKEAITNTKNIALQRATLTFLSMIAQQLDSCPDLVFNTLIPPLLAFTGLPAIGAFQPAINISPASDFDIADLALTSLSFMGRRGPAGLLLGKIQKYFEEHEEHLRLLARYSLESRNLLTFAIVPLREENYQCYKNAVEKWSKLCDSLKSRPVTEKDIETCLAIHWDLLQCAEEVSYPALYHLLQMLQTSVNLLDQPWQQIWQHYLSAQLVDGQYIDYQECAMLWAVLFPEQRDQQKLVDQLVKHYYSQTPILKKVAHRFIANLYLDLRDLRDLRFYRDLRYLRYLQNFRDLRYLQNLQDWRYLRVLRVLRNKILTKDIAEEALRTLSQVKGGNIDLEEQVNFLFILLGRVLQIEETEEVGDTIETEIHVIVKSIYPYFTSAIEETIRTTALDVLCYLPLRTENEITYALDLAHKTTDRQVQAALATALQHATPKTPTDKNALEEGLKSPVEVVKVAVKQRLAWLK